VQHDAFVQRPGAHIGEAAVNPEDGREWLPSKRATALGITSRETERWMSNSAE
jgi:hypothetical protein